MLGDISCSGDKGTVIYRRARFPGRRRRFFVSPWFCRSFTIDRLFNFVCVSSCLLTIFLCYGAVTFFIWPATFVAGWLRFARLGGAVRQSSVEGEGGGGGGSAVAGVVDAV